MKLSINGRNFDLTKTVPLTLGDWRKLKRDYQVSQDDLGKTDIEVTVRFLTYLLKKSDATATEADVEEMTWKDVQGVMKYIVSKATDEDRPT